MAMSVHFLFQSRVTKETAKKKNENVSLQGMEWNIQTVIVAVIDTKNSQRFCSSEDPVWLISIIQVQKLIVSHER